MSRLAEEPSLYPESLLGEFLENGIRLPGDSRLDCLWWAIHTKSRQEKVVARHLRMREISFYLPLIPQHGVYNRHRVTAFMPLFPGYVFMFGSAEDRITAFATKRVARILAVDTPEQFVADLRQIQRLIATGAPLTAESRLVPGNHVRVKRGPLVDLEGTVLVRRGKTRLLVLVNFLQQGASIEIDDFLLEQIERIGVET